MNNLTHKTMSPEVYQLRRRVIALIYEAQKLIPSLPRIMVRITENDPKILALATYNKNYIEISERAITCSDLDLRTIVYHELVHTVFGIGHIEQCPLMRPVHQPLSKEEAQRLFLYYAQKSIPQKKRIIRSVSLGSIR